MNKTAIGAALALVFVLGSSGTAMAGEYTGQGGDVRGGDKAHSACHFSGQDVPDDVEMNPPGFDDDMITEGHVQSYGQYVRAGMKAVMPSPGDACRGNVMH
ncbi:hypothetical protein [Microbacterium neungamense]|uniref:hypothetical protein n=1 Tax=Microbacterium neungamense TaxID=2810535 RepID=UPI00217D70CA|nr:hypothetical protein [Microbacterium neungamense]UWF77857.1 hypothetical protein JSY13_01970 [Microbacterium neungamense]